MRQIFILWLSLFSFLTIQAQEEVPDTAEFMNDCREFIQYLEYQTSLDKDKVDMIINYNSELKARYHEIKPWLNDDQVDEYHHLKGRYTKKLLSYRGERIGDGLQATGDTIVKTAKRTGKHVGSFFKGLFEKDKKDK